MSAVSVRCVRDNGDREGDAIENDRIVTESQAISVGKRFLDDPAQGGYYRIREWSFTVPHKSPLRTPGDFIFLDSGRLGLRSVAKITSIRLLITRTGVWDEITAVSYEVPQ